MARIILKSRYLRAGSKQHSEHLISYIAKREGVQEIDDTWKRQPATKEQKKLIDDLLLDFPEVKDSFEYADYLVKPDKGTASELISRAIDDNVDLIGKRENYVSYIAKRPRAERHGAHGLFTDADVPINLSQVAAELANHDGNVWTHIISLRREDAARLGYDNAYAWRNLLRSQAETIAENMKIPLTDLKWYAAYLNPDAAAYTAQIYGRNPAEALYYEEGNPKSAMLAVFGADYRDHGVLARVDGNAAAGWINARATGSACSWAYAYASFDYRVFDAVTITASDWQYKEYVAASELVETEDFSVSYYILEQGGLNVLAEKCRATAGDLPQAPGKALSAAIYAYGATTQRAAVLGIPYTKTVTATEFSDISEMLDALDAEDGSVVVLLCDFDKAALKENYPGTIRWSGDCGGNSGFAALKDAYPEASFYCIEDLLYEPNSSFLWAKQGRFAKMVSRESLARYTYSPVTYAYTASDLYGMSLPRLISRAGKALDKADCGVAMNYLGSELYGDYSGADGATRSAYLRAIEAMLEEKGSGNAVEGGNEYAIGQADFNYNIPVNSSAYAMQTQSVPFLQMVYHGNVLLVSTALNLTEDPQKELLSCIASGTVPCFAVTAMENENLRRSEYKDLFGTCFAAQEETITELLDRTKDYYQTIYDQHIIDYECVNGVSVTTFEDGVRVIVNFNRRAAEYEGRQIAAMDFEIIQ